MNRLTDVVKSLIIINVIIFVGTMGIPQHYKELGVLHYFQSNGFQPFQLITSMFMHADFMHLLFNMFSLFFLGPYVENTLGPKRFLTLYLMAGFGASLLHMGINAWQFQDAIAGFTPAFVEELKSATVSNGRINFSDSAVIPNSSRIAEAYSYLNNRVLGASGCVYGVVIAFATMFPNLKLMVFPLPVPVAAKYLGVGLIAIGLYSGFGGANDGIAHFAHVGGALVGFLLVMYWKMNNLR